ncbi:hypothetical protein HHI36_003925 [Cryptolaemus montrouzieri]|uniref:Uncharacterized protein n=1 Tax=Cryptolaemus montrouzieri TaxID=559131 RepID=A0ABD2NQ41_9CUCU
MLVNCTIVSLTLMHKKNSWHPENIANVIFERFKFNSLVKEDGQTFDTFVTKHRKGVNTPSYNMQDEMIRDRIVMGISDKSTQKRLLRLLCRDLRKETLQANSLRNKSTDSIQCR